MAPTDLANLKGCGEKDAYEGYMDSLRKGLKIAPEVNHARIPELIKTLESALNVEYNLSGYKSFDEYEAKGVSPNPSQVVRESCPVIVHHLVDVHFILMSAMH